MEMGLTERYQAGKAGLLRLLAEVGDSGACLRSVYLAPHSSAIAGAGAEVENALRQVGDTDTGLAVFVLNDRTLAVAPPFPVRDSYVFDGADTAQMVEILERDPTVGVLLLRLGNYAVGVFRGGELVASKSGSRYVKNRHKAGGTSQRRFERSRERLRRELFDRVCREAEGIFAPFGGGIDHIFMGGERHTLKLFVDRCGLAQRLAPITLGRTLAVERPGKRALEKMPYEIWKSRVYVFSPKSIGATG